MLKIGLIGCGSIGQFLLEKINQEKVLQGYEITAILDEREKSFEKLQDFSTRYAVDYYQDLDEFLKTSIDIVVECVNIEFIEKYARHIVEKKDLLMISIGALSNQSFHHKLASTVKESGRKVYLPTGAIGGIDLVKAANVMGGLESVTLISRKPLDALSDELLTEETVLFKGSAQEAIKKFPKNANVAITLSLAGIGIEKTLVQIIADPRIDKNMHMIKMQGDFGQAEIRIENKSSPTNPKTSYLTALSILATLASLDRQIHIG